MKFCSFQHMAMLHLPIHDVQFQIMEAVLKNESIVLIGETGCGKSTQVPQVSRTMSYHL